MVDAIELHVDAQSSVSFDDLVCEDFLVLTKLWEGRELVRYYRAEPGNRLLKVRVTVLLEANEHRQCPQRDQEFPPPRVVMEIESTGHLF